MRKIAFDPIVNKDCKVLILGTMPSEESLRKQERYGHKSNQFWRIIFTLFGEELPDSYKEKSDFLIKKNIAIWDVLESCEGKGSLDSSIKNEKPNNFKKFYCFTPIDVLGSVTPLEIKRFANCTLLPIFSMRPDLQLT